GHRRPAPWLIYNIYKKKIISVAFINVNVDAEALVSARTSSNLPIKILFNNPPRARRIMMVISRSIDEL
ncbi:unnamed protein product, partial [Amoebophrya sp. A25]